MVDPIIKFQKKYVCIQTAVYWGNPQPDGFGKISYNDPVEIKVRWDEKTQFVRDDKGKEITSKAEVIVLQDLEVDGLLYLGEIADLNSSGDPPVSEAWKIIRSDKSPTFGKTNVFVRTVYL